MVKSEEEVKPVSAIPLKISGGWSGLFTYNEIERRLELMHTTITPDMFPVVGFVGVGRMGANMARRLSEVGVPLSGVFDLDTQKARQLSAELNCQFFETLKELASSSVVIITVVSDDAAMEKIYGNPSDHLLMGGAGKTFLNCATLHPQTHLSLQPVIEKAGCTVLEVPMASSIPQARAGTLFLMCAGEEPVYESMRPLLEVLGSEICYIGQSGTAAQLKAIINMVMNINTLGLAEGLGLAEALGLNLEQVRLILAKTGASSRVLETDSTDMIERSYEVYFSATHAAKDSQIALTLGLNKGLSMALARTTAEQYQAMCLKGLGELDKSGIAELTFPNRSDSP
jgi:3-hydroxyisobutyrate dehydrogenase